MTWYKINAKAQAAADTKKAEVFIYGDIGESWWGETVAAKDFVKEFSALDADEITVRINSYGGSVTDGIAIHNAIKRHRASVTVSIDGAAYSIASLIAMAGDRVEMAENALLMIHAPWGYASGNAVDMREMAEILDRYAESMASTYATKSGKDKADILSLLQDGIDHWYSADEAKAEGFVDDITAGLAIAASLHDTRFRHPAAAAAHLPMETTTMPNPAQSTAAPQTQAATQTTVDVQAVATAAAEQALAAETGRRAGIRASFAKFSGIEGVQALQQQCEDDPKCTVQAANDKLLEVLGKSSATSANASNVVTIADERDKFKVGVQAALLARAGIAKDDTANNFRGYSLLELARMSLRMSGINAAHMSKMDMVAAAFTHSGSDFPLLLANVAQKAMLKGYEEAEETFQKWTSVGTLPDFKAAKRVDLNTFPSLSLVPEGAEYTEGTFGERGETIQLATYGRLFGITRQAIINDDLDAFSKIPRNMGRAAIRTLGNLVYAVLTGNPTMADGKALFHADHSNLLTAAAPGTSAVAAMQAAMRRQKDATGTVLNVRMAYALCPVSLETALLQVRESDVEIGGGAKNNTGPNAVRNSFEVISDARLDETSTSVWYGAASASTFDTIEVAYLDGVQTPTLEQQNGWNVDGVQFKVRLDAGVKALDHRTLAKNPWTGS